jgi:hypothetical protein
MIYPHNEKIKEVVKTCSSDVIEHGLNYLVPGYSQVVQSVDIETSIYEYLNDMDGRDIINRILEIQSPEERKRIEIELTEMDKLLKSKTIEVKNCIWGEDAEKRNGLSREINWWYYRAPKWLIEEENLETL